MSYYIRKIKYYNKPRPLSKHFIPLIGDKKEVKILDVGSGPYPITGQLLDGVNVDLTHCDSRGFENFWANHQTKPMFPIEVENMEKMTYADNSFDIVQCINALDHTKNALAGVKEMIRVCKPGGWVYIDCSLNQHSVRGKKHYWDARPGGIFLNEKSQFDLKELGFQIEYIDNGGEPQYDRIIAKLQK